MSSSPSEALGTAPVAGRRGLATAARHALSALDRRRPVHTLLVQTAGAVSSWQRAGATRGAGSSASSWPNVERWCEAHPGAAATVFVSGHLLHNLVIDPRLGLHDSGAVRDHAAQQFVLYHGAAARGWPLAVWSADGSALACALHALDLGALQAAAARHGVRLRSVRPAWAAGLASLGRKVPTFQGGGAAALALVEGRLLAWLVVDNGRIVRLQQRFLDATDAEGVVDLLERLIAEGPPLRQPPLVTGWDLGAAVDTGALSAAGRWIGPLDPAAARAAWILDAMDGAA